MIKSGNTPVFDPERLRAISDAARARAVVDSSRLKPTSLTASEGMDVTMPPLEGPDPGYVTGLEERIREVFRDDLAVMEKMAPRTAAAKAAGHLATDHESDHQRPTLHTLFQSATNPASGTVTPKQPRTMQKHHVGTLPPARTRLEVPGHTRSRMPGKVGTFLRGFRHRDSESL